MPIKPFFISIPHSGEQVPQETTWLQGLDEKVLMCDVDRYVDRLYQPVIDQLKVPSVVARWHRYVVDLNRWTEDVDAQSVQGSLNPKGTYPTGLHWSVTTKGDVLIPQPMSLELHEHLVKSYFEPFHRQILDQYEAFKSYQAIYHIDAHSMPSRGTSAHKDPGQYRPQIVVSDYHGQSSKTEFKDLVIAGYKKAGLEVAYNFPYVGGRLTQRYGRPQLGHHVIQVEINRDLYMDENSKQWQEDKANQLQGQLFKAISYIHSQIK